MKSNNCNTCAYYCNTGEDLINCAVNPDGNKSNCKDYQQIVPNDLLVQAIAEHNRQEFLNWRAEGIARFGIEIPVPEVNPVWTMPEQLIQRLNSALPSLVQHPKLKGYSQIDIAIALLKWTEDYILRWISDINITESADSEHFPLTDYLP